ncbi:MAG: lysylphosphatidylglycerol synthase transmembrane domain-containing protein [Candidatus Aminicenantes bacterium]|nr:lysylphosphatidylglycerol synthase transmembrane domain-containing protein [Candidatus Aminicenantes bacterium]
MKWNKITHNWKIIAGILLSLLFIFLAFRQVDFSQMGRAFADADYWLLVPILAVIFISLLLRAWRWQYLLAPIRQVQLPGLFASLVVGYMANTFLPAHLGEVVRAYHARKKTGIAASAVFATIVVERLLDIFALLMLMGLALAVFPFPGWVQKSGVIMLVLVVVLFALLLLMKKYRRQTMAVSGRLTAFLPDSLSAKVNGLLDQFLNGIVPLKAAGHYPLVGVLSFAIWACYAVTFQLLFHAFDFVNLYHLPWTAALVALVITTISVVVPSSPGYIGSYHFLCQLALGLFAVPKGPALSYAFVLHAVNMFPVFFLGLFILSREKISLRSVAREKLEERE